MIIYSSGGIFLFSRHLRQEKEAEKSIKELEKGPKLDLGFKEGQTIRINISVSASYPGFPQALEIMENPENH